jgi:hypothetical protein
MARARAHHAGWQHGASEDATGTGRFDHVAEIGDGTLRIGGVLLTLPGG